MRSLYLDWCSHRAARFACEHWHYSAKIPVGKLVRIGVWENDAFIGAIIFGDGLLGAKPTYMGIDKMQVVELVRIALREHKALVSRMIKIVIRLLLQVAPTVRLLVSFADPAAGHNGAIYQASNWIYTGLTAPTKVYRHKRSGRIYHSRNVTRSGYYRVFQGTVTKGPTYDDVEVVGESRKYRYLYPLDKEMRKQIEPLALPYPKRPSVGSIDSDVPADQAGEGGASPTPTLQIRRTARD